MPLPWQREQTLEELEELDKRKDIELSIAQKKAALAKLKEHGLTQKSFGGNLKAIMNWVKTH